MHPRRILIVAAVTAAEPHVREIALDRMRERATSFLLLVPSIPPLTGMVWTEGEARSMALERMAKGLSSLRSAGANVHGKVGDARLLDAIADEFMHERFDEIIISTLPSGLSRWTLQDLSSKARRRFGVRVTHVVARVPLQGRINADSLERLAEVGPVPLSAGGPRIGSPNRPRIALGASRL